MTENIQYQATYNRYSTQEKCHTEYSSQQERNHLYTYCNFLWQNM